jgi:glucose-fructose oxidoreductase
MNSSPAHSASRRDFIRLVSSGSLVLASGVTLPLSSRAAEPGKPAPRKLGVAMLGLGRYAERELGPALKLTQNCHLVAVITGTPEKGPKWAQEYGLSEKAIYHYDRLEQIADNPDIDIVYVVTPPGVRRPFVERCAKAGKHVISEKPLATTVEDCDAMIAACKAAKVMFSTGYRLHFDPYHREMERIAHAKEFGELKTMAGERAFVMAARAWRVDKKIAGGGPLFDLGIYIIQAACMIAGNPIAVTAKEGPKLKPELFNEVEETIDWTMEFANGATCTARVSYNGSADKFRAEGSKGWIEFPEKAFTYRGSKCVTSRGPIIFPPMNQQAAQIDDFADCVRTGRQTSVPGEMGRRDIQIMLAIYDAARTGKKVALSL